MNICKNEECGFYDEKIIDNCANETLCNIGECGKYLKEKKAPSSGPFSDGLDGLSGSEAVYGLLAWLTCRDEAVTFSAKHNANIAAELAKQFCEENNLAEPRDDYHTRLIHPKGEVAIAGRGKNKAD